jgi:hypothetical protein
VATPIRGAFGSGLRRELAETGLELWRGDATALKSSGDGGGRLVGMLAAAIVTQIIDSSFDPSREISSQAAWLLVADADRGVLPGAYSPEREARIVVARADLTEKAVETP